MAKRPQATKPVAKKPAKRLVREHASWTIKSVPVRIRMLALNRANAQDQTLAEWVSEAVEKLAAAQSGMVIPPDDGADRHLRSPPMEVDLPGMAQAILAITEAARAAGTQPPATLAKQATTTVQLYMRTAREAIVPPKKRKPKLIEGSKVIEAAGEAKHDRGIR